MGGGVYSSATRAASGRTRLFVNSNIQDVFTKTQCAPDMNPRNIEMRECRDSEEHPNSLGIIVGLDVTGSMGEVPKYLIGEGLPHMMDKIIKAGVSDPMVCFMALGDHECDQFPLQVGQFESSDGLMDKWLSDTYLERGGGGNRGESYHLAWWFASNYVSMDCWDKRPHKGLLITVGDEPCLQDLPQRAQQDIKGQGQYGHQSTVDLLADAQCYFHVYHITVPTMSGRRKETTSQWDDLLGDNHIIAQSKQEVADIIADVVSRHAVLTEPEQTNLQQEETPLPTDVPGDML